MVRNVGTVPLRTAALRPGYLLQQLRQLQRVCEPAVHRPGRRLAARCGLGRVASASGSKYPVPLGLGEILEPGGEATVTGPYPRRSRPEPDRMVGPPTNRLLLLRRPDPRGYRVSGRPSRRHLDRGRLLAWPLARPNLSSAVDPRSRRGRLDRRLRCQRAWADERPWSSTTARWRGRPTCRGDGGACCAASLASFPSSATPRWTCATGALGAVCGRRRACAPALALGRYARRLLVPRAVRRVLGAAPQPDCRRVGAARWLVAGPALRLLRARARPLRRESALCTRLPSWMGRRRPERAAPAPELRRRSPSSREAGRYADSKRRALAQRGRAGPTTQLWLCSRSGVSAAASRSAVSQGRSAFGWGWRWRWRRSGPTANSCA